MQSLLSLQFAVMFLLCLVVAQTPSGKQENNLGVVRFFEPWTKRTADGRTVAFTNLRGFEVRKNVRAQAHELIFAMKDLYTTPQGKSQSSYSDDFYAVSVDGQFRVRRAGKDEWQRAQRLLNTRHEIFHNKYKPDPLTHTNDEVIHRGKRFRKSGKFWPNPSALVSSSGRLLAVFSFSSSAKPRTSWSPLDGGMPLEPAPGEIFVDIYDTSSGRRVQTNNLRYDGSPSMLFGGALWAGDDYLIVPLDPIKDFDVAGQACFLVILPQR